MRSVHFTIKTPAAGDKRKPDNSRQAPSKAQLLLAKYENLAAERPTDGTHLLRIAQSVAFSPISLVRKLLITKYPAATKQQITEMIRFYDLIPDPVFALNVSYCVFSDPLESGLIDMSRKCIGEEYEVKLKELSKAAGLVFYDEGDLRRDGYDKTPDLKMAVPFVFQGKVVNWIESKALFGSLDQHKEILKKQLVSYANRFGHGLVIYWMGYLDSVEKYEKNGEFVTVLDRFPDISEIELVNFNKEKSN